MKYFNILFITFLTLLAQQSYSCSCFEKTSFCITFSQHDYIAEVEVIDVKDDHMGRGVSYDLKVIDYLTQNSSFDGDTLHLVEFGTSCDLSLSSLFEKGDSLIITFYEPYIPSLPEFPEICFYECGTYFIQIKSGYAFGDITNYNKHVDERMNLNVFENNISNLCVAKDLEQFELKLQTNVIAY